MDSNVSAIRMLVRVREDFQSMRKRVDNRIGRKANGQMQAVGERDISPEDFDMFADIAKEAKAQEKNAEKQLKKVLKRFTIYNEYLKDIKGVGEIAAGWIIGWIDIHEATTVSKIWQYAGMNPGEVRGKVDIKASSYKPEMGALLKEYKSLSGEKRVMYQSDKMIRGDRLTPGFISPFNGRLRTALCGVMADGFIKCQNSYALEFYYPYKNRLENSDKEVLHVGKMKSWKDVTKGHRDRAAKRYMVKMFLKDLYPVWRSLEGLPVREPYQDEYLGHRHGEKKSVSA